MNLPTLIILLIVLLAVVFAVRSIYTAKKTGRSCSCGGNCSGCPGAGMCHSEKNK